MVSADSIKVNDSLRFVTPKGKVVYGGGGIIPDVFVSIDTTMFFDNRHYRRLNEYVFDYYDTHRKDFEAWESDYFMANFDKDKKIYLGYLDFLSEEIEHIEPDEEANLQKYLKALFAQQIYDESLYYQVINQDDIMLERVMELEREGYPIEP